MYIFIQRAISDLCGQKVTTRLVNIVHSLMYAKKDKNDNKKYLT